MAITVARSQQQDHGLRPLKPSHDLLGVADLIEEAFIDELDRAGRDALREMRWLGYWGILLVWLDFLSPDVNTYLNGFVWVDRGKIVGNTTVSRNFSGSNDWFISNVAVARSHRGQGLARQLMTAALEFVKEMDGYCISLQVKQGNTPAVHLYESLGFKYISATAYLSMAKIEAVPTIPFPSGVNLRPRRFDDRDAGKAYDLARLATPVNVQKERPLSYQNFRLGSDIPLANGWRQLLQQGQIRHWLVEDTTHTCIASLSVVPGTWRSEHKLSLMVHPDWWGKLESPLVSVALTYLQHCPARSILFQHPAEHTAGIEAMIGAGFNLDKTHLWMKLVL